MVLRKYFLLNLLLVPSLSAMDIPLKKQHALTYEQKVFRTKVKEQTLAEVKRIANTAHLDITIFGHDAHQADTKINKIIQMHGQEYKEEILAILDGFFLINHMPKSAGSLQVCTQGVINNLINNSIYQEMILDRSEETSDISLSSTI